MVSTMTDNEYFDETVADELAPDDLAGDDLAADDLAGVPAVADDVVLRGDTLQRVRTLIAPIVADLQLDLYDLEFRGGTLRITLDTPAGSEHGITLESIALATRLVSRELDHHDPVPGHYTLEVTSPGLERALRTPAHFRREIGKTVAIRLRDVAGDARRVQGVLIAADDHTATVRVDGDTEHTVRIDQIDRARTVFEWGPAPKPGGKPAAGKKSPADKSAVKKSAAKKSGAKNSAARSAGTPRKDM